MTLLILGISMLWLGLLLWPWLKQRGHLLAATDALMVVTVGGLVLLHILPHAVEDLGLWAVGALLIGIVLPSVFEQLNAKAGGRGRAGLLVGGLIFVGLTMHAFMDGMALATARDPHMHQGHSHGETGQLALAVAVIVHRLPAGLALGWFIGDSKGMRWAIAATAVIAAATVGGWFGHDWVLGLGHGGWMAAFEALVAGSLMHLLLGHHPQSTSTSEQQTKSRARWGWAGASLGAVSLLALSFSQQRLEPADLDIIEGLWPPVVIATLLGVVGWRLSRSSRHHQEELEKTLAESMDVDASSALSR